VQLIQISKKQYLSIFSPILRLKRPDGINYQELFNMNVTIIKKIEKESLRTKI
jgi:hypothetical protein